MSPGLVTCFWDSPFKWITKNVLEGLVTFWLGLFKILFYKYLWHYFNFCFKSYHCNGSCLIWHSKGPGKCVIDCTVCWNTQILFWLTEILWDHKFMWDVTGCQKTQVSDCTSSTVFLFVLFILYFLSIFIVPFPLKKINVENQNIHWKICTTWQKRKKIQPYAMIMFLKHCLYFMVWYLFSFPTGCYIILFDTKIFCYK